MDADQVAVTDPDHAPAMLDADFRAMFRNEHGHVLTVAHAVAPEFTIDVSTYMDAAPVDSQHRAGLGFPERLGLLPSSGPSLPFLNRRGSPLMASNPAVDNS